MYYALVQGDLIARQIDPGPSSAMSIKARTKERSTCKHSLATTCCLVPYAIQRCHRVLPCLNISSVSPSQFAAPCFANSSALTAVFRNLHLAPAFHAGPLQCFPPSRKITTFLYTLWSLLWKEGPFILTSTTDFYTKIAPRGSCSDLTGRWQSTSSTTWAWLLFNIRGRY